MMAGIRSKNTLPELLINSVAFISGWLPEKITTNWRFQDEKRLSVAIL
jgi:hypothetical protein